MDFDQDTYNQASGANDNVQTFENVAKEITDKLKPEVVPDSMIEEGKIESVYSNNQHSPMA